MPVANRDKPTITEYLKDKNNKKTTKVRGVYSYNWETTVGYEETLISGTTKGTRFIRNTAA